MTGRGHVPDIATTIGTGTRTWISTCPVCDWIDVAGGTRSIIENAALEHEYEHHPERRPAPPAPTPDHGLRDDSTVRYAHDWSLRVQCWCGLVWKGADDQVLAALARHVGEVTPAPPAPQVEGARRLR
jgi:hypothetical protein